MTNEFKRWKDSTTTSPSTRHLGHYKSFIILDGNNEHPHHSFFNTYILQTINTLIISTIDARCHLKRWLSSTVIMIEKILNTPRIDKLRVTNIYEAYYNLLLKYYLSKKSRKYAEITNTLEENQ